MRHEPAGRSTSRPCSRRPTTCLPRRLRHGCHHRRPPSRLQRRTRRPALSNLSVKRGFHGCRERAPPLPSSNLSVKRGLSGCRERAPPLPSWALAAGREPPIQFLRFSLETRSQLARPIGLNRVKVDSLVSSRGLLLKSNIANYHRFIVCTGKDAAKANFL